MLRRLIAEPGIISACYSAFHAYSFRNRALAEWQLSAAGVPVGPIATFKGWIGKGRCVQKGQKAIALCVPCIVKAKPNPAQEADAGADEAGGVRRVFTYRKGWFAIAQTAPLEGAPQDDAPAVPPAVWDEMGALARLNIQRVAFEHTDGNCQGYACGRSVAVNPVAALPHKTLFHELAHVVLGHTAEALSLAADDERTPRTLREVEAEAVAYLCCQTLGLSGASESRGYVQHWMAQGLDAIPDKSAQRIMGAADKILTAGGPQKSQTGRSTLPGASATRPGP